jgi:hypothetical protein
MYAGNFLCPDLSVHRWMCCAGRHGSPSMLRVRSRDVKQRRRLRSVPSTRPKTAALLSWTTAQRPAEDARSGR